MVAFYQFQEGYVSPSRVTLSTCISPHDQHTLPIQRDAMHECATRRGWMVLDTVVEIGSAAKNDRPKRQAVLTATKQRQLAVMLVWKLDWCGRPLGDVMTTLQKRTTLGVGFVSLTAALALTTPAGRAFASFLAAVAACAHDVIRKEQRAVPCGRAAPQAPNGARVPPGPCGPAAALPLRPRPPPAAARAPVCAAPAQPGPDTATS
jgi:hypothetical protein